MSFVGKDFIKYEKFVTKSEKVPTSGSEILTPKERSNPMKLVVRSTTIIILFPNEHQYCSGSKIHKFKPKANISC